MAQAEQNQELSPGDVYECAHGKVVLICIGPIGRPVHVDCDSISVEKLNATRYYDYKIHQLHPCKPMARKIYRHS